MCVFSHVIPTVPSPPTGTIVSLIPLRQLQKLAFKRACARVCVSFDVCVYVRGQTHTHKITFWDKCTQIYQTIYTLGRERVISKSILLEKKRGKKKRPLKPPPVLADCKGLSVTAGFYWAKGKQQDSTWGPIKGHSSWKSALAHGLECTRVLIFRAVGAHSIFTGCVGPAGTAAHADAITLNAEATQG